MSNSNARVASLGPDMLLTMDGICKSFPGVQALWNVDLSLRGGEVHALLGENGAGKSTLIKVLSGALVPDRGDIRIDGVKAKFDTPIDSQRAGVAVIYQEFNLVPGLSATENIFLGHEPATCGFVHRRTEAAEVRGLFQRMKIEFDPETPVARLSIAQQQVVEIAKALWLDAKILVMDEPSATLTTKEFEGLVEVIRDLKSQRIGIIYISHRLEEVFSIADRVTVLRDGQRVGTQMINEVDRRSLIAMMVGRELEDEFPPRNRHVGPERLVVKNLVRKGVVDDVSFSVRRGEILGITGLVGAGRTEMARLLFGADHRDGGTISLDGRVLRIRSPSDAIREGICLLTEDRKSQGLILKRSVRENFGLPNLARNSIGGFVNGHREKSSLKRYIQSLRIRTPHHEQTVSNLSGGNQQKVVLAKWLQRNCEVILFDEPTRGIDVGAKYEIYQLMNQLTHAGKAVIMISSELPEILGMSDRVLVMHGGRVTGQITDVSAATQEQIMQLAVD